MSTSKKPPMSPSAREAVHDQRSALVKAQVARENAELDARTARLKALRLQRDAELAAAPPPPPTPRKRR